MRQIIPGNRATSGCVALQGKYMDDILKWLNPEKSIYCAKKAKQRQKQLRYVNVFNNIQSDEKTTKTI